jgi:hypothetical protein
MAGGDHFVGLTLLAEYFVLPKISFLCCRRHLAVANVNGAAMDERSELLLRRVPRHVFVNGIDIRGLDWSRRRHRVDFRREMGKRLYKYVTAICCSMFLNRLFHQRMRGFALEVRLDCGRGLTPERVKMMMAGDTRLLLCPGTSLLREFNV